MSSISYSGLREYHVNEHRLRSVYSIEVSDGWRAVRSWHVWLNWNLFSHPAERIEAKRRKAHALARRLNEREQYLNNVVNLSGGPS